MYKHKQNQRGSSHLFLLIIVLLAIAGGVGYLFWNNVLNKQTSTPDNSQKSSSKESPSATAVKMKQGQTVGFPVTVSWSYPETWTMKREGYEEIIKKGDQDTHGQMITLTSPTKAFEVVYNLYYNGGIGGVCPRGDNNIQYIEKQKSEHLLNTYFFEAVSDGYSYSDGKKTFVGYGYTSGLMQNDSDQVTSLKAGEDWCITYMRNFMQLPDPSTVLQTRIEMKNIQEYNKDGNRKPIKDIQTIKDQFTKDEYKDAVKILLSTMIQ